MATPVVFHGMLKYATDFDMKFKKTRIIKYLRTNRAPKFTAVKSKAAMTLYIISVYYVDMILFAIYA
jgi:hypothetical protein